MAISQVPISTDSFTAQGHESRLEDKADLVYGGHRRPVDQSRPGAHDGEARQCKTIEVNSSHVAYMSHPKETAKLIEEAATSAHVKSCRVAGIEQLF